jgi:hydrogenase maturation factor
VDSLPVGKLPSTLLEKFLGKIRIEDEQVLLGPTIGEDVAVIRLGDRLLVAKTDPVTFAADLIGWYAVNVNANDIATMGVRPRWFLATVLLPEGSTAGMAEAIFDQILEACRVLEIAPVGGHTEITYGLQRPVVVGCMLAEAENRPFITTSGARVGDDILLTKGIAIEGTAVLAREARPNLLASGLDEDTVRRAANYLFQPGISVLKEALIASASAEVRSMHDPTEGGLATGLAEVARAGGVGIRIASDKIPVLPECRAVCDRLELEPLGLLASGGLIITLAPAQTARVLAALGEAGIDAGIIGRVVSAEEGLKMHTAGGIEELPQFARDELARFMDSLDKAAGAD